jgi:hypothetical protein
MQLIHCQPDPSCNELHIWTSLYHHWSININKNIYKYRHSNQFLIIKPIRCTNFSNLFLELNSTRFGQSLCPSSGIFQCTHSNSICHTGLLTACEQEHLLLLTSCQQTCMTCTIAVCTVKNSWWWKENSPKHVEFHSKYKFEKLVHLIGFIIRNLSWCTVTRTSNSKQV